MGAALIEQVPALPIMVRAQRAFLARAVRFLVGEAGVRQFLDIGTGIPTARRTIKIDWSRLDATRRRVARLAPSRS
ncbi:MAG: SAM-dependent methyltransferase [Jiangellaceae bacterium]